MLNIFISHNDSSTYDMHNKPIIIIITSSHPFTNGLIF